MFDLDAFIASCVDAGPGPEGSRLVEERMSEAVSDPEGLRAALSGGGLTSIADAILHRSDDLTILNVALPPNAVSPPHDHTMWAVIGIYEGCEENTFFTREEEGLVERNERAVRAGEAVRLGDGVIHAIANGSPETTLGLHVYGGDLVAAKRRMWHPKTGEELPYEAGQFFRWTAEMARERGA